MKEEIGKLIRYQEVTTQVLAVTALLAEGPKKINKIEERLAHSRGELEENRQTVEALKKDYRSLEMEFQSTESLIAKIAVKRDAVKSNREYRALFKEEDQLKFSQSKAEDRMLALLEEIETAEAAVREQQQALGDVEEKSQGEKRTVEEELDRNRQELESLKKKQAELAENLQPDVLSKFNHVRKLQPRGVVVVPVTDANCGGCNMNIPPQMFNELQKYDRIRFCPHCQRIVYWNPPAPKQEA
jgi:predicted  nucleic acid-binding Zn-ribbon protein